MSPIKQLGLNIVFMLVIILLMGAVFISLSPSPRPLTAEDMDKYENR